MRNFDALVAVGADHHGLLRTEDATAAGVATATIRRLVLDGRLERLAQGLYRVAALPVDRLTPYMEAVLWARGKAVVSHASALEMLELCDVSPRRIHITVPENYNPRRSGHERFRVHRYDLPETDITMHDGVPVVTTFRAIKQAIRDGENPEQLRLAIGNGSREGLLLRSEAAQLRGRLRR